MTASKVRADYEQLAQIAQVFCQQSETTQQVLRALQNDVNTLQRGDWVGKGAEAFYAEMNTAVLPAMKRVVGALSEASNTTERISRIMKQAEDDAAALFRLAGAGGAATATLGAASLMAAAAGAVGVGAASAAMPANATQQPGWVRTGKIPLLDWEVFEDKDGNRIARKPTGEQVRLPSRAEEAKRLQEEKDRAKKAACRGVVAMNDAAIVFGIGGLLLAPFTLGGSIILGIGSFGSWYTGNRYQELCNDPPRDDYQTVLKFEPLKFTFQPATNDAEQSLQDYTKQTTMLAVAMKALVSSIERYDGIGLARQQPDNTPAKLEALAQYEVAQVEAITHNAAACAQLTDSLVALRPNVNIAWQQLTQGLQAGHAAVHFTPAELKAQFVDLWHSQIQPLTDNLGLTGSDLAEFRQVAEQQIREQEFTTEIPNEVLNEEWSVAIQATSATMRQLSETYAHLTTSLQKN